MSARPSRLREPLLISAHVSTCSSIGSAAARSMACCSMDESSPMPRIPSRRHGRTPHRLDSDDNLSFAAERFAQPRETPLDRFAYQGLLVAQHMEADRALVCAEPGVFEHRGDSARQPLAETHGEAPVARPLQFFRGAQLGKLGVWQLFAPEVG